MAYIRVSEKSSLQKSPRGAGFRSLAHGLCVSHSFKINEILRKNGGTALDMKVHCRWRHVPTVRSGGLLKSIDVDETICCLTACVRSVQTD